MSGAHGAQEPEHSRGEVALVLSPDGLSWLHRRRCSGKGRQKRNEEVRFWISSGQMTLAEEERQPIAAINLWRNRERRSSPWSSPPLLEEPLQQSTFTSVSECPKEASWKTLIFNIWDIFSVIPGNINITTQQHVVKMDQPSTVIVFCDEVMPLQLAADVCRVRDRNTLIGADECGDENRAPSHFKNAPLPADVNNNSEEDPGEVFHGENLNIRTRKSLLKPCQSCGQPGESSERDRKLRKSVSFDDDVMVYLFDQEGPTMELHPEPCTPLPNASAFNLQDAPIDDSGLEWDDDFSALEKGSHLQCVSRSLRSSLSTSTASWAAASRPRLYLPSQTGLFLTHVAESDLEL